MSINSSPTYGTKSEFIFEASNYNILIVEDSKSINKILNKTFSNFGFNCFSAFDLKGAYEQLSKEKIDYLMLDINLPDGRGTVLIEELKDTPEKIFVLTGENDNEFRNTSYQKGVIDFLIKDKNFFKKIGQIIESIIQLEKNRYQNILIIDESQQIQEKLEELLVNRNYQVQTKSDTNQIMDMINHKKIDLLLLDTNEENLSGLDFLEKNNDEIINVRKIPVLMTSAGTNPQIIRDSLKAGAVDVIKKPYILEEVTLKVDLWIDYRRKTQEVINSTKLLEEYKDAVDESNIVSKTDTKGIITYVNEEFCKISGYTPEELVGKPHNIVRHPDMPSTAFKEMWNSIKKEKRSWQGKVKNRKKDGSHYWVNALIKPILDTEGNIIEFIGLRNDITQEEDIKEYFKSKLHSSQKNLASSIKLSKEYEKAINESNILSRSNLNGEITYVNKRFTQVSGYSKEELIGKNHNIVRHPDTPNTIFKQMWYRLKKGRIFSGIIKNKAKDGTPYWVDTTIVPIKNEKDEIVEYMAIRHNLTELFNLHKEIESTQKDVVYKMGEIGETRSKETGNHVKRVAEYSKLLAKLYGLNKHQQEILFTASPMHDIGKVGIPDEILKKPGKLTAEEFEIMKEHAEIGYSVLSGSKREVLQAAATVSYEHHEKWNGKGYPRGLKGEEIHIYGRITAIADVFDALGSDRVYKKAWADEKIFSLFLEEKGEQFDPKLVDLFLENKEDFIVIRDKFKD